MNYRTCTRCVMDTTDPEIVFDANGICNHCHTYDDWVSKTVFTGEDGRRRLAKLIEKIKQGGKGKDYDCVIGVSGGVDSTFVALKVKELGLRPLAVHLDNGWDSELSVANIHKVLNKLGIDLHTHVMDWEEFRDLQLAFLRASTPDSEIPSDHAIITLMHQMAKKVGVRYIIAGYNRRTESHHPSAWSYGHLDWKYIRAVQKRFGHVPLKTFPHMGLWTYYWYRLTQERVDILNYLDYDKNAAIKILEQELGWKYYGGKHYESIYTRFYQGYILPKKFGYDKRRMHLSSLICSGALSRADALSELEKEPYPIEMQRDDREYVIKKFDLTEVEFDALMNLPKKTYRDYPSYGNYYQAPLYIGLRSVYRTIKKKLSA